MTKSEIIEIAGAGPVLFERSHRARRLNITVRQASGVRVAVPLGMSFASACLIVQPKVGWIRLHQERLERERATHLDLLGDLPLPDLRKAREKLKKRLDEMAAAHGFSYNRLFLRQQKTRWGSCSARNNINLNLKLARLPDELLDYVILHELVHTRIKNHGVKFWAELEGLMEGARQLDRELGRYRLDLL